MKSSVKILLVGALTLFCASEALADTLNDSRDGKSYKTVRIGEQTWMAENLNYETEQSVCYKNDPTNCEKYGRLYTWEAAKKACPSGWPLPSNEDFRTLLNFAGGSLKEQSVNLRSSTWENGIDKVGFSALPAGGYFIENKMFGSFGRTAIFWSSTEDSADGLNYNAYYFLIGDSRAFLTTRDKTDGRSVRCIKD